MRRCWPQFAACESEQQAATPEMRYATLLAVVHGRLAHAWGVAEDAAENERFGGSIGDWPAFPDTVDALRALRQRYRLVILSNVDRDGSARAISVWASLSTRFIPRRTSGRISRIRGTLLT